MSDSKKSWFPVKFFKIGGCSVIGFGGVNLFGVGGITIVSIACFSVFSFSLHEVVSFAGDNIISIPSFVVLAQIWLVVGLVGILLTVWSLKRLKRERYGKAEQQQIIPIRRKKHIIEIFWLIYVCVLNCFSIYTHFPGKSYPDYPDPVAIFVREIIFFCILLGAQLFLMIITLRAISATGSAKIAMFCAMNRCWSECDVKTVNSEGETLLH